MNTILIIFAAFATYYIADVLVNERGPFDICFRIRKFIGIEHDGNMVPDVYPERFLPLLFSCVKCLSVWVGFLVMLSYLYLPAIVFMAVVMPFGLSGAAVLIDSLRYKG